VDDGVSLEAQQAKIEAWCLANDYELVKIYRDEGISGKSMANRDGLLQAMDFLGRDSVLVTYSMSRISRNIRDMLDIGDELQKKGANLVSLTEKIDTTSAAGKMIFNMLAVMNQFERDQISERTTAALQYKKSIGQRIGTIPYGYSLADDGVHLIKNQQEQEILSNIMTLRKQGYSLRKITAQLNADGVMTRRGSEWRVQYIHNLLKAA